MKRSQVIYMVIIGMITTITFFAFKAEGQKVKGWFLAGSYPKGYDIGVENNVERNGHVAFLKSVKSLKADKFGTILQTFIPDDYLGKRVRLTGYLKTNIIKGWVGMWFRIDGDRAKPLGFDNMQDRKIKGITDWKKYEIVLDVPANSKYIAYGVLLAGSGTVWLDDLRFEVVSKDVSDTNMMPKNKPQNTSFEESEK